MNLLQRTVGVARFLPYNSLILLVYFVSLHKLFDTCLLQLVWHPRRAHGAAHGCGVRDRRSWSYQLHPAAFHRLPAMN